jgi:hypothetical protein
MEQRHTAVRKYFLKFHIFKYLTTAFLQISPTPHPLYTISFNVVQMPNLKRVLNP